MSAVTPTVRRINFASPSAARSPYIPGSGRNKGVPPRASPAVGVAKNVGAASSAEESLRAAGLDVVAAFQSGDIKNAAAFATAMRKVTEARIAEVRDDFSLPRSDFAGVLFNLECEREMWCLLEQTMRMGETVFVGDMTTRLADADAFGVDARNNLKKLRTSAQWLEQLAAERLGKSDGANLQPFDDPAYKRAYSCPEEAPELDFKGLTDVEVQADERVGYELWRMLLAGKAEEADQLCRSIGQSWRSACSLGAGRGLAWISADGTVGGARKTWRKVVAKVVEAAGPPINAYERATLAVLAGLEEPALLVCSRFADRLWVRLSCQVNWAIEGIAEEKFDDVPFDLVKTIFLQTDGLAEDGPEARVIRVMQASLALGRDIDDASVAEMLLEMKNAAESPDCSPWLLRTAAHVALLCRIAGVVDGDSPQNREMFEDVIFAYIQALMRLVQDHGRLAEGKLPVASSMQILYELIARFCSQLHDERCVNTCATLLRDAMYADLQSRHAAAQRLPLCLKKLEASFDSDMIQRFASAAIDLVWESCLPSSTRDDNAGTITENDVRATEITSILVRPEVDNPKEMLSRTTRLARRFAIAQKSDAVKHAVDNLTNGILAQIPAKDMMNERHEVECWRHFFFALSRHNEWRHHFYGSRPVPPSESVQELSRADPGLVPYEAQAAANVELNRYLQLLEEYNGMCARLREVAVDALRAVLTIPGGWMRQIDDGGSAHAGDNKQDELKVLRGAYVPMLVSLLHNILHESKMHSEASKLANLVADERLRLFDAFSTADLRAFLLRARVSFTAHAQELADRRRPEDKLFAGEIFEDLGA